MEFKVLISMTNGFREIKKHPKQNLNLLSSLAGLPLLSGAMMWSHYYITVREKTDDCHSPLLS